MKSILIVDDDKTNLLMAKNALADLYKVIAVPSGMQALNYLDKNKCDLILLDVEMPGMDGIETLTELRTRPNGMNVPVILLTANKNRETVIEGVKLGILDYITKPFTYQNLRERVAGAIRKLTGFTKEEEIYLTLTEVLGDLRNGQTEQAIPKLEEILNYMKTQI